MTNSVSIGFEFIKEKALNFVRSCHVPDDSPYAYCMLPGKPALYMASGNAAMFFRLFKALDELSNEEIDNWALYLNSGQQDDGYIFEPWLTEKDLSSAEIHSFDHTRSHNSRIAIMGLLALGMAPRKRLKFVHPFFETKAIRKWLDSSDWKDVWFVGNEIFDLGLYLGIEWEAFGEERAKKGIDFLLDELVRRQEPETGLWATGRNTPIPAMAGAFHLYPIFIQFWREIPYPERIVDFTLAVQDKCEGYCPHFDAIHILANMMRMTNHRRPEVEDTMRRFQSDIILQMREDGGFPPGQSVFNCYVRQAKADSPDEAALWCTLFRYLTIGLIASTIKDDKYAGPWDFRGIFHSNLYPVNCGMIPLA